MASNKQFESLVLALKKTSGQKEARELLKYCSFNLDIGAELLPAAKLIEDVMVPDASPAMRYRLACFYVAIEEEIRPFEILCDLAWEDGFAPAQWRLGKYILQGRVPGFDRSTAYDLLETAKANGHKRASQAIAWGRYRDSKFPLNAIFYCKAVALNIYVIYHRDILGRRDQSIL